MVVYLWSAYSKRLNSTTHPAGSPAVTLSAVRLKDNSGILHPVLEIYKQANWNPKSYNYAWIQEYNRYYFVNDWTWNLGNWECSLDVDVLASWKTQIGIADKYVLRAASRYDNNAVDTFYPALGTPSAFYYDTKSMDYVTDYDNGTYILGVANQAAAGAGAISYYVMSSAQIRALVQEMLPTPQDTWATGFTGMTDTLYRALYSPFDYIKSCKWFPISLHASGSDVAIAFGNYTASSAQGKFLVNDTTQWGQTSKTLNLPSDWLSREAKKKNLPYTHLYLVFNPFGVIELNPHDFSTASSIRITQTIDFVSGESMLKIYAVINNVDTFITQIVANLAQDINLSSASVNASALLKGALGTAAGVIAIGTGGAGLPAVAGVITTAGSVADTAASMIPTPSGSVGQNAGGARMMDGIATLIVVGTEFADEHLSEFGRPLLESVVLNTLSGYIKCADGEINTVPAYREELEQIGTYLTGGFYYE